MQRGAAAAAAYAVLGSRNAEAGEPNPEAAVQNFLQEAEDLVAVYKKEFFSLSTKEQVDGMPDLFFFALLTLKQVDTMRDGFLKKFGSGILQLLEMAAKVDEGLRVSFLNMLNRFDCYGLVYRHLHEKKSYLNRKNFIPAVFDKEAHFRARATDFLPDGGEVLDTEIDPRIGQLDQSFAHHEEVKQTIIDFPGWTKPERQRQFREVISEPEVRAVLTQSDCTLAEAYSLVKAVIRYRELHPQSRIANADIAKDLLQKREVFKQEVIAGPETDQFIYFGYGSPLEPFRFDPELLLPTVNKVMRRPVGDAVETKEETDKRITTISGNDELGGGLDLRKKIWESRGKTTVYIDTHGAPSEMGLNSYGKEFNRITVAEVAHALLTRLLNDGDRDTLVQCVVVFEACYSYDFQGNLLAKMKEIYGSRNENYGQSLAEKIGIPFEKILLPTIITSAQEGSVSYGGMTRDLQTNYTSLGPITGEYLLRRVQPKVYESADIVFFLHGRGEWDEIGAGDRPAETVSV
ncbi:MAG: hypothetical protein UY92_C0001G0070 [Candidatus Magasanikbacteria bacterium GW2011_GWA2_56_11]|uniref:Uncharacterized protein n=1 Tax=Candidatus Magasanikbacteria bacterium GW2011_GWA2_56_11 TaxID=1619044 RepID=A0A0G1YIK4_9BACT|nr:MAG: hypothetical protein UY92_C0001G0070 [Candidatus Magasanikbacteria bacterium GW2011_GWA2_56_11]